MWTQVWCQMPSKTAIPVTSCNIAEAWHVKLPVARHVNTPVVADCQVPNSSLYEVKEWTTHPHCPRPQLSSPHCSNYWLTAQAVYKVGHSSTACPLPPAVQSVLAAGWHSISKGARLSPLLGQSLVNTVWCRELQPHHQGGTSCPTPLVQSLFTSDSHSAPPWGDCVTGSGYCCCKYRSILSPQRAKIQWSRKLCIQGLGFYLIGIINHLYVVNTEEKG